VSAGSKRFRFPLETVLRVRRVQEEQARGRLMTANRNVTLAVQRVDDCTRRYSALERPGGRQSVAAVESLLFTLDAGAGSLVWAHEVRANAVACAREELAAWSAAEQRVRTLERLRERARDEHAIAMRREDDRAADELATTRALRRGVSV
jgi:flagellar FliJ protein